MFFNTANYNSQRFTELEKINNSLPTLPIDQKEVIKNKIHDPSDTRPIDQKQFALTFGDTFIKGTALSGGYAETIASYYLKELEMWEKDPSFQELTSNQINSIQSDIRCFLEAMSISKTRSSQGMKDNSSKLKNFIRHQLDKNGKVVLPLLVNGMQELGGHVFSCVFKRGKDGTLSYYFLNKGSGSNQHPVVKSSPLGKEYRSYRSASFAIADPEFFNSNSSDFLINRIISSINSFPTLETLHLFESRFIYEDFSLFADEALTKKQLALESASFFQHDELGITPQRGGNCPEAAIRLIIRDNMVRGGVDRNTIRRVMFYNKMRGLKNGFHHLLLDGSPAGKINSSLLRNGAEGVAVQAAKLQRDNLISFDQLKEALILVEETLNKVADAAEKSTDPIDLSGLTDFTVSNVKLPNTDPIENRLKARASNAMIVSSKPPECTLKIDLLLQACLDAPGKILSVIEKLNQALVADPIISPLEDLKIATISSLLLRLPPPRTDDDPYWSRINPSENAQIIEELFKLTEKLGKQPNSNLPLVRKQICAITHRLLCNDPKIGKSLQNYTVNTEAPAVDKFLFYYPNGENENLNNQLDNYFKKNEKSRLFSAWIHDEPKKLIVSFLETGSAHYEWIDTLKFYKSCIENLEIQSKTPVSLYVDLLQGNHVHPVFKSLFYLNNLAHSARANSSLTRILGATNHPTLQFLMHPTKEKVDFLPLPKINDTTLNQTKKILYSESSLKNKKSNYKSKLENCNLSNSLQSQSLDSGAIESLMRLRKFKKTRLPLFIDWCTQHQDFLHLDDIQHFLENALLNDNVVRQAEISEPKTVLQLKAFLDRQMKMHQNKTGEFIFWARLSVHVESRLNVLRNYDRIKSIQESLYACSQKLFSENKNDAYIVALHHLYIYSLFPELARLHAKAFMQLHSQILLLTLKGAEWKAVTPQELKNSNRQNKPEWMSRSIDQLTVRSFDLFQKSDFLALTEMNAFLNLPPETCWRVKYPHAVCDAFRIDFHKLTIYKNGHMVSSARPIEIAALFQGNEVYSKCVRRLIDQDSPVYKTETSVEAIDGSFRLECFKGIIGTTRTFKINGIEESFYTQSDYSSKDKNLRKFIGEKAIQWVSVKDPNRCLVLDINSFEPTALVIRLGNSFTMERVENGMLTGEFAVSPKETAWGDYLSSLSSYSGGLVIPPEEDPMKELIFGNSPNLNLEGDLKIFCKKNAKQVLQLSTIIIDRLEFRVEEIKGKLRLRSKDFPEYFLANDQWQGGFSIKGMIWLEDAKKTRCKGVIPCPEKALEGILSQEGFEEEIKKDIQNGTITCNPKIPFVYNLDTRKGKMIGESAVASLLQVIYYAREERYLEAFDVLQDIEKPNFCEKRLLSNGIISKLNQSPAATALKIHACLLWETGKRERFENNVMHFHFDKLWVRYLQFCSSDDLQRIPEPLRINSRLHKKFTETKETTSKIPLKNDADFHAKLVKFLKQAETGKREKCEGTFSSDSEDSETIEDFLENTKDAFDFGGEKKLSSLSTHMMGKAFSLKSLPEFLERCQNEPFPSQIDLDINLLERIVDHQDFMKMELFSLMWLFRRTKDKKLKKCLINIEMDADMVQHCIKLLASLPKQTGEFGNIKQIPRLPLVVASKDKLRLPSQTPLRASPFKDAVKMNCKREEKLRLQPEPAPLERIHFTPADDLGQRFAKDLKKAHQVNSQQTFTFYSPEHTIEANCRNLEQASKIQSIELLKKSRVLLNEIEILANYPTEEQLAKMSPTNRQEVVNYRLKQQGQQSIRLTFRDPLLQSLLMGHGAEIKKRNPFLEENDVRELHTKMLQYLDLMNQKTQADVARPILRSARRKKDKGLFSKAAALLNHDRRYDLHTYPELSVYEYATGFQLRPEQVDLLIKIITLVLTGNKNSDLLQQLCFEFQAGGGKTKVISAILAARIHAEGKVPVFFSVPQLEEVTGEDFKEALRQVFERKLSKIHFTIKDTITVSDVQKVLETFENALEEKGTFFMTPETWHALNLAKIRAIRTRDVVLTKALDVFFDYIKTKGVALIDEGHLNIEALHETNKASGPARRIPRTERKLFVTMTRHLMQDPELQKIVKLAQNKQSTMLAKHLPIVKKRLSVLLWKEFKRDLPKEMMNALQEYWLQPDAERPHWMIEMLTNSKENLHEALLLKRIDLVRGLLNVVLPFTLNMTGELDYRPPTNAHTEIFIPAKQGFASNSNFQNPDVAALVSCQGTFQNGLSYRQLGKAMEQFVEKYDSDLRGGIGQDSKSAAFWLQIQEEVKLELPLRFTLQEYRNATKEQKEALLKGCSKQVAHCTSLIEHYLVEEILPKVAIYPIIEQSTAINLAEAFDSRIVFSATMGIHEKYALQDNLEESYLRDMEFMDQVMTRACLLQNSKMHWKPESTPKDLLKGLASQEFAEIEGILNVGSFCEAASCEEWADAFLSRAKEQGVDKKAALYFKQDDNGKRILCLKLANEPEEVHMITGSNLSVVFTSLGLRVDQVYKIFGPSDTTGTDFLSSPQARMLLTIGNHVNLSLAVQSIMRMRGFLNDPIDPEFSQKISWVGAVDYLEKLQERFPSNAITPLHFFAYALEKEVDNDRASIKQQAVQEIEAIIVGEVEARRRSGREIDKHIKAYERNLGRDPSALYGGVNSKVPTKDHLTDHAKTFAAAAGLTLQDLPPAKLKKIDQVAERAGHFVKMTEKRAGSNLTATMEQSMLVEQKQEQKQEQRARVRMTGDEIFAETTFNGSLFSGPINQTFGSRLRFPHQFVNPIFPKDLYFSENAFSLNPEVKGQPSAIKRVELFLVEEVDGCKQAFVLSGYDADRFISAFDKEKNIVSGKKLGIFTSTGNLVRNGPEGAHFTDGEIQSLVESEWMKNKVCEIGFWNGKVVSKEWMAKKLKSDQRNNYLEAWSRICNKHANPAHLQITTMDELIAETDGKSIELSADLADAAEYPELNR